MRFLGLVVLLVIASGCGSLNQTVAPPSAPSSPAPSSPAEAPRTDWATRPAPRPPGPSIGSPRTAVRAVSVARSLLETPYVYGGEDRRGFDCSGLMTFVFEKVGVELPRTAEAQAGVGHWVAPDELRPGDLVFFGATRDKPFHVGLVVSEPGQSLTMIHSATSKGVVETNVLASGYWLDRFKFGRRILP